MAHTQAEHLKHVRAYITVFAILAALTIVTVGVSYLQLATMPAIVLAITIAGVKASLVMGCFMHLINERQAICGLLIVTAVFMLVLLVFPMLVSG